MRGPNLALGKAAGVSFVQVVPSQVHVSSRNAMPLVPPNSTTSRRAASYAIPIPYRRLGDVAGASLVQVVPSQVHVSPSTRDPTMPPNSTTSCLAASYAMPGELRFRGESAVAVAD